LDSASLKDAMDAKYDSVMQMVGSQDFIEGPKAFSEKRAPNWQGK
jgi:crotonobetainyl-CoA hydratase